MSMLGLRDLVLIAPSPSSLHHHQQQQQQHQHNHQNQPISSDHNSSASLSVGFGIFPLLTATPCMPQPQPQPNQSHNNEVQENNNNNFWNLRMCPEPKKVITDNNNNDDDENDNNNNKMVMMESEENGVYGSEYRVCHDCGNRAKKDCVFRRCRTCCKGRGYDCSTHLKSTWIPSTRRRDREGEIVGGGGEGCSGVKRPKILLGSSQNAAATSHSSNSNATTPKSFANSSCHQDASFKEALPGQVHAPAVFKCHRVTAIGNGEDEFAYLATVHISGHVFKGFLYDHGVDGKNPMACVSELQLGNNCSGKNGECSSAIGAYPASAS
ncbi:hypothetical protein RYX36_017236 [Vicia faba]